MRGYFAALWPLRSLVGAEGTEQSSLRLHRGCPMSALIDFFALRPVFTFFGLKIVWYLYLLHMFLQLYISIAELTKIMSQRGIGLLTWLPNTLPSFLGVAAEIAIVRLLIEVAATILLAGRRQEV